MSSWLRAMFLLCVALSSLALYAQNLHALRGAWRDVKNNDTPASVLSALQTGQFKSFDPSVLHLFPHGALGSWVVLRAIQINAGDERVLSIYPAPTDTVELYDENGSVQSVAMNDFDAPLHGHGRLAFKLTFPRGAPTPILLKFEPLATTAVPTDFRLQSLDEYLQDDANWLVFVTACFAVMIAMAFMALCFAMILHDVTFAWYAGYMFCYVLIQCVQTGYLFHPLGLNWLAGFELLLGTSAVALSVAFAAMFIARFCDLERYAPMLRAPIICIGIGMPLIALMRCVPVPVIQDMAQTLVNPALMLAALVMLCTGAYAAFRGSRQAWFFLIGWTPLLALTAMTSAQATGALPNLDWLNDASIATGAFEAIVLSLGLADRTLSMRRDRESVRVLADRDALTNIFNRRAWNEACARLMSESADTERPLALLFLDLDHFKTLNDNHGHAAGDRALVAVANVLRSELRPSDLLGRYGGEEFVALLAGTHSEQALQVATRLCRRVHRLEIPVNGSHELLSVSIGLAMRSLGDTLETLIERADQAMYQAKLNGRNHVHIYERRAGAPVLKSRASSGNGVRES